MKKTVILPIILICSWVYGQEPPVESNDQKVFAQIFTGFRYSLKDIYTPRKAFEFSQGIIGYQHKIGGRVTGKIMYDVTRTTHIYEVTDTAGNLLGVDYFEGSKYTAYLKMAEILWEINEYADLRVGQLLNTQYLTFLDPFWGYRYIDVTFQEKYRLGMPADFGVQLDLKYKNLILNQFSVVNGEGPFRYQDDGGEFIWSDNIQISPVEGLTLKIYGDYGPTSDTSRAAAPKYTLSGFAGYRTAKYRAGVEYNRVSNWGYLKDHNYSGISLYGGIRIYKLLEMLARYDYLVMERPESTERLNYYIIGVHYEPVPRFTTSLNFRYYSDGHIPMVYASFGLKF